MTKFRSSIAAGLAVVTSAALAPLLFAPVAGASSSSSHSSSSSKSASYTVKVAKVQNVGDVLVNGNGRTLYMLTSEAKAKKITCTSSNGCFSFWPPMALPHGVNKGVASSGAKSSLLGTFKESGANYVTYNGWPLYTYKFDSASGQAHGQGVKSFGGTWYVLNASGQPVTSMHSSGSSSSSTGGSSSSSSKGSSTTKGSSGSSGSSGGSSGGGGYSY